jgi:2-desacetyl-2-hydroxyethyl bacteriochlorophyllide A dehydrogenase
MKAVVIEAPHRAHLGSEPTPRPGEGQVLVRVAVAGVCMSDVEVWKGTRPEPYVRYPVIPGHEWCGTVVEIGPGLPSESELREGDRVAVEGHNFCRTCAWCRRGETNLCASYNEHGFTLPGGFAEYVAVRADLVHRFESTLSFEAAALTEPFACVMHGVRRASFQAGGTAVIVGPGTLGLLAVGWAKASGAARIVAVGADRTSEAAARSMGADEHILANDDAAARIRELTDGRGADLVVEAAGHRAVVLALDAARRGGSVVLLGIGGGNRHVSLDPDVFALKDLRVDGVFAYTSRDFGDALQMIETERIDVTPLITHQFTLQDFEKAFDLLARRGEPVVKVILRP